MSDDLDDLYDSMDPKMRALVGDIQAAYRVAGFLKQSRESSGLTVKEVSELVHSQWTSQRRFARMIRRYESGEDVHSMALKDLFAYARALGAEMKVSFSYDQH